jgi:hypothetical protein
MRLVHVNVYSATVGEPSQAPPANVGTTFAFNMIATVSLLDPNIALWTPFEALLYGPPLRQALLLSRIVMELSFSAGHSLVGFSVA